MWLQVCSWPVQEQAAGRGAAVHQPVPLHHHTRIQPEAASKRSSSFFIYYYFFFLGQRPLVPLLLLGPPFFSDYSFRVHHLVNWDDRHLLAHAMASDFSAAWQCLSKRTIGFFVTDQTPRPYPTRSLPAQLWHRCTEWSTVWVSTKPLISEENWPGRGLNPGLPNDTPALYPLLHELMLL
jgi:hypothetical protein